MILFVFEGERREVMMFKSIEHLFFSKGSERIILSFKNNIYELYHQMKAMGEGADIVGLMKETGHSDILGNSSDYSEIYLFFDLDIHNQNQDITQSRLQIREMLDFFDNETENGKLYINYPMIESIYHTQRLPDPEYLEYTVKISQCSDYKKIARDFGPYSNLDHLCITERNIAREEIVSKVRRNWIHLIEMNRKKSFEICRVPFDNERSQISQGRVFENQEIYYIIPKEEIAILNSFPLFLAEYFKPVVLGL